MAMAHAFSALSGFLVFRADPRASRVVLFWLLASFGRATWDLLLLTALALAVGTVYLLLPTRQMNALVAGEDTATALMTGVVLAVSGVIGFVRLMLPHAARWRLLGGGYRCVVSVCRGCCCGTRAKHPEVDALAHSRPGSAFGWAPECGGEGPPPRVSSGTGELIMRHLVQPPMAVAGMVEHEGAR
jgi:ABC-type cobalamin transport system permease subunit